MTGKLLKTEIEVTFPFALLTATLLTFDKTGIMSVSLLAAFMHEVGHLVALYAFGLAPSRVAFRVRGIEMVQTRLFDSVAAQITVAAAGPLTNLTISALLLPFCEHRFAASLSAAGIVIGLFNLLPLAELDGGEITLIILSRFLPTKTANAIEIALRIATLCLLTLLGLIIMLGPSRNPTMLIASVYLTLYAALKHR